MKPLATHFQQRATAKFNERIELYAQFDLAHRNMVWWCCPEIISALVLSRVNVHIRWWISQ